MLEIFICEFIDDVSLSGLPGTVYLQGAVAFVVLPFHQPVIYFSFQIHGNHTSYCCFSLP